jgi:hypothetical protein
MIKYEDMINKELDNYKKELPFRKTAQLVNDYYSFKSDLKHILRNREIIYQSFYENSINKESFIKKLERSNSRIAFFEHLIECAISEIIKREQKQSITIKNQLEFEKELTTMLKEITHEIYKLKTDLEA